MKRLALLMLLPLAAYAQEILDAPAPNGVRPGGVISQTTEAPDIPEQRTPQARPTRNWPEQPPTIPHNVRGYQVDKNFNQCLSCHSRSATEASGAPMVSITHFWNREGQPLAAVSPRRYFCVKCHVPQHQVQPIKNSTFRTIDQVLQEAIESAEQEKQ